MSSREVDNKLMALWVVLCIGVGIVLSKQFNFLDLALTTILVVLAYFALGISWEEHSEEGPANPFRDPQSMGKRIWGFTQSTRFA